MQNDVLTQHSINSGSNFFAISVLLAIFGFFIYTVVIPKIRKK